MIYYLEVYIYIILSINLTKYWQSYNIDIIKKNIILIPLYNIRFTKEKIKIIRAIKEKTVIQ